MSTRPDAFGSGSSGHAGSGHDVYLLGPQRFLTTVGALARSLQVDGPIATVTAGWQERESADAELDAELDGRSRNLHLYARLADVLAKDPHIAASLQAYREDIDELSALYAVQLGHAVEAYLAVERRPVRPPLREAALASAVAALRALDVWFGSEVRRRRAQLNDEAPATASEVAMHHRAEVVEALADVSGLAIAGGHVAVLLRVLRLFAVTPAHDIPVIGWSAGAMVLTDHVVLFNDHVSHGSGSAEVWDDGLGLVPHVVALPHARRRLDLVDTPRMAMLAQRFAGSACLLLDDGVRVPVGRSGELPEGAKVIGTDGTVHSVGAP